MIPGTLRPGDEVRVVALSRSLGALREWYGFGDDDVGLARERLEGLGLSVSFAEHVEECDDDGLVPFEARLEDLHAAFADERVRCVMAVTGGAGAIQLLDRIDYALVANYPKAVVGYSDIAYLHLAFHARADLAGCYGPHFGSFARREGFDYTLDAFRRCLLAADAFDVEPSPENAGGFWPIAEGEAEGDAVAATGLSLNMLKGTRYLPDLSGAILFLDNPSHGKASLMALDSDLRALGMLTGFERLSGLVVGRYPEDARIDIAALRRIVGEIPHLAGIPVLANADFGHTAPSFFVPTGGRCRLRIGAHRQQLSFLQR